MLMPPAGILRAEPPPDNVVVVIRGGERSLDDAVLDRTVGDCWAAHGFFGLSVFADPANSDIGELARRTPLVRRPVVRTALVGRVREAGFEVMPTFSSSYHFSIVLPDATAPTFEQVRLCFGPPMPNPGFDAW
ncbi:MAG TPA: hypothetical protein VNA57_07385 [Acidimicrobiales bacterium]|nr:hypothetical protein [Acidimicrobiales bacterium]